VDLERLQAELGQFVDIGPYKVAGEFIGKGEVSSTKAGITANGNSSLKNLKLSSDKGKSAFEPMAEVNFDFNIDRNKKILDVETLKANASFGQIDIKEATFPLDKESEQPVRMEVEGRGIDMEKLGQFAVLFGAFPEEMKLSGIAESKLSISGKKNIYRFATDATEIANLKVSYPGKTPFEQRGVLAIFDVEIDQSEKSINVKKLRWTSSDIKIRDVKMTKQVKGDRTVLKGRADLEYDWEAISTLAGTFLPEGLQLKGKRKDTISFSSDYPTGQSDKMMANLNSHAKLGFAKADYMGLNFGSTDVDIQVQKGLLKISPFSTTVNKGQLNFAGGADFKNTPVLFETPGSMELIKNIQINRETTKKLLTYVNPIFANAVNVTGVLNFDCNELAVPLSKGSQNDIKVEGIISISNLRMDSSDLLGKILFAAGGSEGGKVITVHPTRFVLQDGYLKYDDMRMDIGNNPVNFSGTIGLDKSLDMKITLPYTKSGKTVRVGEAAESERITVSLGGTVDHPELDLRRLFEGGELNRLQQVSKI